MKKQNKTQLRKISKTITQKTIVNCQKWFEIHNINTFIHNKSIYLNLGNFEVELSKKEIEFRAKLYTNSIKINK